MLYDLMPTLTKGDLYYFQVCLMYWTHPSMLRKQECADTCLHMSELKAYR